MNTLNKDRFALTPEEAGDLPEGGREIVDLLNALPPSLGAALEDIMFFENVGPLKVSSSDPAQPERTLLELIQAQSTEKQ